MFIGSSGSGSGRSRDLIYLKTQLYMLIGKENLHQKKYVSIIPFIDVQKGI